MPEEQKIITDVVAGTTTFAAWMSMVPDFVAIFTGVYILVRLWETETVKKLLRRD